MKKLLLILIVLGTTMFAAEKKKVLYFTHEPGKWHKYTPQKAMFIKLAEKAGWELTVSTGEHAPQVLALRNPDLTKGFDAVVYNYCFASSKDLQAVANVIAQTRENGTPAMLIHCSMHSFWSTYKQGKAGAIGADYKGKALADPKLVEAWNKLNTGKEFPAWGDFTGVASTKHGPKVPIAVTKCCEHESTKSLSKDGYNTVNAELYNNFYVIDSVKPILKGEQTFYSKKLQKKVASGKELTEEEKKSAKKATAIVMWEVPQGKGKVLGLSLGHGEGEWNQPEFQSLVIDGVNFLLKK